MCSLDGDVCVVTGACGFLGKTLIRMLLDQEKNLSEIRLVDINVKQELLQSLQGNKNLTRVVIAVYFLYEKQYKL